jgi:hypothetical protein
MQTRSCFAMALIATMVVPALAGPGAPAATPAPTHTLFLTLEDDAGIVQEFRIGLHDFSVRNEQSLPFRFDSDGVRWATFGQRDAKNIAQTLRNAGVGEDEILGVLFSMQLPVRRDTDSIGGLGKGPIHEIEVDPEPLDPECDSCESGQECTIDGWLDCCKSGGRACTSCHYCYPDSVGP